MRTIMCSGGFDPLHVGHLSMFEAAASYGHVLVVVNSDDWLLRKKGYVVMPVADRVLIVKALGVVTNATPVNDADGTVCEALWCLRPDYFANGGDRIKAHPFEAVVCEELGIEQVFNVGDGKIASSSELVRAAFDYHKNPVPH